jgi:drug/metabolite transporter (DMT)-like permease
MSRFNQTSQHIPLHAALLLVLLCLIWGGNIVSIKVSNQGIPPLFAATIRSVAASFLLWLWSKLLRERVGLPAGSVRHGVALGFLFGGQFLFLYWGLSFTTASRAAIFVYVQPIATALMAHFILHNDGLHLAKAVGICISFIGLIIVFSSESQALGELHWVGDLMVLGTGLLWAITTVYVKKFIWNTNISHFQTLFSQLFFSIPLLAVSSLVFEWRSEFSPIPVALAALVYQSVVVAFISYLAWFSMIHSYPVSRLAAFTFLTPLFGVLLSGLLLGESITILLCIGLGLVVTGIYLVNRPSVCEDS